MFAHFVPLRVANPLTTCLDADSLPMRRVRQSPIYEVVHKLCLIKAKLSLLLIYFYFFFISF